MLLKYLRHVFFATPFVWISFLVLKYLCVHIYFILVVISAVLDLDARFVPLCLVNELTS